MGEFDYDNFADSKFPRFYWTYLIVATFLTQITFFNMLIANMGTTYERVRENEDRNVLRMRTKIFSEYAHILIFVKRIRVASERFLFVAHRSGHAKEQQPDLAQVVTSVV